MVFICRLCGKCENDASGVAIFGEQGVKDSLSYKIKLSLDISVFEYDPLPKYICESCHGKIIMIFSFQESCRRTQILLRERFLMAKSWTPSDATGINLEHLSSSTGQEISMAIGEPKVQSLENSFASCKSEEEPCSLKESGDIYIKRPDNVVIGVANILPLPNSIVVPQDTSSMQPVIPTIFQSSGIQNSPQLQAQLAFVGNPFQLQTVISNGIMQEFMVPVGDKSNNKLKTRKPKQTPTNKQRKGQTLPNTNEIVPNEENSLPTTSFVGNLTVVGQEVNNSVVHIHSSSGVQNHEVTVPKIVGSCTNESIRNLSGTLPLEREQNDAEKNVFIGPDLEMQENTEKSYVYIGPDLETPDSATLADAVVREQSSQQVDKHIQEDNPLKILDVFTVQETSSTDTADTPDISGTGNNWHSPLAEDSMSSTVSSSAFNPLSSSNTSATQWYSPSPSSPMEVVSESTKTPPAHKRKKTDLNSESVKNCVSLEEDDEEKDEDDILVVEIVKANKGSIAKHWEKCESDFRCKLCMKTYKKLVKCENHIRIHLGIKPYECHICKRRYHKKRLLNEHCCEHLGKKLYQCIECDKAFRYRKNFKTHVETHVESENSNYCCEICGKGFSMQFDYWSHKTSKHIIEELRTVVVE